MAHTLRMPEVAANATHATLVCWNKAEGERIEAGQSIADLETDKAVVELPVEQGGIVGKLLVANGAEVPVGQPIAVLLADGETLNEAVLSNQMAQSVASREAPAQPGAAPVPQAGAETVRTLTDSSASAVVPTFVPAVAPTPTPVSAAHDADDLAQRVRVFSSPVARLLAKQHGLDLAQVSGSGPKGRVTKHDVVRHVEAATPTQSTQPARSVTHTGAPARIVAPTATRRTIAKRLSQSKLEVPHFYLRARCDVSALLAARQEINAARDVPVSINDFVIRACAVALIEVPQMNVSWRGDGIYEFDRADISVAVDTPNGLLTPIIDDASHKTLSAISAQMRELARIAREGRLQPAQFQGGTFSVSNLGMFGVSDFDAIINPPQAGILAVGAVQSVPVVRDGVVAPGQVMDVVLSVDHRVVDGAVAARWLAKFRGLIEQPLTMLV